MTEELDVPKRFPGIAARLEELGWEVTVTGASPTHRYAEIRAKHGLAEVAVDARKSVVSQSRQGLAPRWKAKRIDYYVRGSGKEDRWQRVSVMSTLLDFAEYRDPQLIGPARQENPRETT